jgi:hypothetical protein
MSTLIVEICLTKFVSYKVYHHYTYAVLATVIFGFGAAGTFLYLFPGTYSGEPARGWRFLYRVMVAYALALLGAVALFCWIPVDPYDTSLPRWVASLALPLYMLLFFVPFFLAGLSICLTLIISRRSINVLYFWDILAAAAGAVGAIFLLSLIGGYGAILFSAALGIAAALMYAVLAGIRPSLTSLVLVIAAAGLFQAYPKWAQDNYGFDIRSTKDLNHRSVFAGDFGGIQSTYWNPIARIDISKSGNSASPMYRFGFAPSVDVGKIPGRYVLVDGGANTRQLKAVGTIKEHAYFRDTLWAAPYIAHPPGGNYRSLVIGGGGGIDVLIAKYFDVPEVDVAELNPATYRLLTGELGEPESELYRPWLVSDSTRVNYFNSEGRHFCTTRPDESYDVIQASGVDTLTAISTGGMSLAENYLYTTNAVEEYWRVLKPDGVLSLSHYRTDVPTLSFRMLRTYLKVLKSKGIEKPWLHLVVVATTDPGWTDVILKKTPFTGADVARLTEWVESNGMSLLFIPTSGNPRHVGNAFPREDYFDIGYMDEVEQGRLLATYRANSEPVVDDKPYFYQGIFGSEAILSFDPTVLRLIVGAAIASLILIFLPFVKLSRKEMTRPILGLAWYFALCGFAFMIFETGLIQIFGIFVGGPTYSLAFVLVSVLTGYALGSYQSGRLSRNPRTFLYVGLTLFATLGAAYFLLPPLLKSLMYLPHAQRLMVTVVLAFLPSFLAGIPVALAMEGVRRQYGSVVAWMWSVNSALNVLAALVFVPLTLQTGISFALVLSGGLYLLACLSQYRRPLLAQ